jgi:enoyl-[acyl-carrier-protein] reductase (NADH)
MMRPSTLRRPLESACREGVSFQPPLTISTKEVVAGIEQSSLLKRLPTAANTARLAAFLASDGANFLTGAIVNASSGSVMD